MRESSNYGVTVVAKTHVSGPNMRKVAGANVQGRDTGSPAGPCLAARFQRVAVESVTPARQMGMPNGAIGADDFGLAAKRLGLKANLRKTPCLLEPATLPTPAPMRESGAPANGADKPDHDQSGCAVVLMQYQHILLTAGISC